MDSAKEFESIMEEHGNTKLDMLEVVDFSNGEIMEIFHNGSRYEISKEIMALGSSKFIIEKFNNFPYWKETVDRNKRRTRVKFIDNNFKKVQRSIIKFEDIHKYIMNR